MAADTLSTVRNLNLLDNELEKIQAAQTKELSKGDKADDKILQRLASKMNVLFNGNDAAAQRTLQFEIMHDADENNVNHVKKLDNKQAQAMNKSSAVISLAVPFITLGCQFAGFDTKALSTMLTAFGGGLSGLGKVSDDAAGAAKQELQFAAGRLNQEIQDKQSTNSSSKNAEATSLRQIQDADAAYMQAFNAMVAGLR
jgi:hypothetical protein